MYDVALSRIVSLSKTVRRWPLVAYFGLAYAISWGGVLVVVGPDGFTGRTGPDQGLFLTVVAAQFAGPFLAGGALCAVDGGAAGLRDLWRRQCRVRVGLKWYVVALGTTPVLLAVVLGGLSTVSPAFVPGVVTADDRLSLVAVALVGGLVVAFFEEIGWTGFALPRLEARYTLLTAGVLLGVVWGAWHAPADFWGNAATYGGLWPLRIALWVVALTAYRVVIAWVYDNTGSLLLAQLAHAGFVSGQAVLGPAPTSPENYLVWYGTFAGVLWVLVGVIRVRRVRRGGP